MSKHEGRKWCEHGDVIERRVECRSVVVTSFLHRSREKDENYMCCLFPYVCGFILWIVIDPWEVIRRPYLTDTKKSVPGREEVSMFITVSMLGLRVNRFPVAQSIMLSNFCH